MSARRARGASHSSELQMGTNRRPDSPIRIGSRRYGSMHPLTMRRRWRGMAAGAVLAGHLCLVAALLRGNASASRADQLPEPPQTVLALLVDEQPQALPAAGAGLQPAAANKSRPASIGGRRFCPGPGRRRPPSQGAGGTRPDAGTWLARLAGRAGQCCCLAPGCSDRAQLR